VPCERLLLELADAFACEVDLLPDRFECLRLAGEAVAKLEDASLARW